MFALSAVAVDKEMLGRESDAELIDGLVGFREVGCSAALAASSADWAVCVSGLDLGEVENSWVNRLDFPVAGLIEMPPFSSADEKDGKLAVVELVANGLVGRRGISGLNDRTVRIES
jgi:hypothetical protein